MDQPTPRRKNRETILLAAVAILGLVGIVALQVARKRPSARSADRAVVQAQNESTADAQASAKYQRVTGRLMHRDIQWIEVGQPFTFYMDQPVQGAIYELDLGDGSPRKLFKDNKVQHVFQKNIKQCRIVLFAKYNGEEVALDTLTYPVQKRAEKIHVIVNDMEM
ncbi:MAG TPA: hypothetical protein PK971_16305 [Saprospiraceae bacterium]|nr:hypothetical protein [Saprospiraceae bacterium]HND89896.1 hypothetical protein [Saprospiraceae bacterium]HNG89808.1 hypothetical protein [Saprospiraceae bacterium]